MPQRGVQLDMVQRVSKNQFRIYVSPALEGQMTLVNLYFMISMQTLERIFTLITR